MSKVVKSKNGKKIILLNPAERAKKYAQQLKKGRNSNGEVLTDAQYGFRMGVLNERKLQAKIFKRNKKKSHR